uniref:Uncharacterized protein n=1 Tax=Globisporangium ultimum (strain ATCC 200006 / CBS 805.95 / DAOM BR144) TaxID=431595 RepID=K3WYE4_GLOUD
MPNRRLTGQPQLQKITHTLQCMGMATITPSLMSSHQRTGMRQQAPPQSMEPTTMCIKLRMLKRTPIFKPSSKQHIKLRRPLSIQADLDMAVNTFQVTRPTPFSHKWLDICQLQVQCHSFRLDLVSTLQPEETMTAYQICSWLGISRGITLAAIKLFKK